MITIPAINTISARDPNEPNRPSTTLELLTSTVKSVETKLG